MSFDKWNVFDFAPSANQTKFNALRLGNVVLILHVSMSIELM